jgi:hypothetical protein
VNKNTLISGDKMQEEDDQSIEADVKKNPQLEMMFNESAEQYKNGHGVTTSDL